MVKIKNKKQYWYSSTVESCVLCGKEKKTKERVYKESEKGTKYVDTACWIHF